MIKTIEINEETVNYVEGLDYETTARRDLICFMLQNDMDISTSSFKEYQKEYNEYFAQFQMAKKEVEEKYISIELRNENTKWTLDYGTRNLTIEVIK